MLVVPGTRRIDEILAEFQTRKGQLAVIIDEWRVFEGVVTIEDILEETVGGIRDEFDTPAQEQSIERREDGGYAVDGGVPLKEVNDVVGATFDGEGVETVGGVVLSQLGWVPAVGDEVERDGYVLRVDAVEDARIARLLVRLAPSDEGTTDEGTTDAADEE